MNYTITYEHPNSQYIPIRAEFKIKNQKQTELIFPSWRPGRYELGNFAKNIHGFKVYDQNNKSLKFEKTAKNKWLVQTSDATALIVKYKYFAAELNAGSTFMDDQQLYVNPVNCLVYIEDQQKKSCTLQLTIPEDFKIACGASHKGNIISTKDFHELVDSPFIASPSLQHESFTLKGVQFHLWFQGKVKVNFKKVINDIKTYTSSQINKFDNFPVREYHYLYQILQVKAYHGVEHQTSTVIALGPSEEVFKGLYDDFLGVSSHELYHTWNVKAIRPKEMMPYNYAEENYTHLGYVAEGVTTYMGDLFLCESGVKDFKWYKKELELLLQKHFDNFGRFNYSVAESSWDTWLDGYVQGAPNRKVSIYNEGALLSLVLDLKIRQASANKFSLHDVMNELYQNFGLKNKGYTARDFQKTVEKFASEKLNQFFEHYYYGTYSFEPILVEAFVQIGLEIKMEKNPSFSQNVIGIKTARTATGFSIQQIYPGSTADLAGMMLGDCIEMVNGKKIKDDLDTQLTKFQDKEISLTINRMGRTLELGCPNTNKSYFPQYNLKKTKHPSNLAKRIFKKWCGHDWDTTN